MTTSVELGLDDVAENDIQIKNVTEYRQLSW